MGDLQPLADSIARQGLLQPVGITADRQLVFGARRVAACRDILGRTEIAVRIVDVTSIVEGEHDENQLRKVDADIGDRHQIVHGRVAAASAGASVMLSAAAERVTPLLGMTARKLVPASVIPIIS
jgi:ParB-like nuclease domain